MAISYQAKFIGRKSIKPQEIQINSALPKNPIPSSSPTHLRFPQDKILDKPSEKIQGKAEDSKREAIIDPLSLQKRFIENTSDKLQVKTQTIEKKSEEQKKETAFDPLAIQKSQQLSEKSPDKIVEGSLEINKAEVATKSIKKIEYGFPKVSNEESNKFESNNRSALVEKCNSVLLLLLEQSDEY